MSEVGRFQVIIPAVLNTPQGPAFLESIVIFDTTTGELHRREVPKPPEQLVKPAMSVVRPS